MHIAHLRQTIRAYIVYGILSICAVALAILSLPGIARADQAAGERCVTSLETAYATKYGQCLLACPRQPPDPTDPCAVACKQTRDQEIVGIADYCKAQFAAPPAGTTPNPTPQPEATEPKEEVPEPHSAKPVSFSDLLSQGLLRAGISEPCKNVGKCQITDILQIGLNAMTFILGISGSVFLLMFVYGGFTWLTSAGTPGKIDAGLHTLRDAIVGLIVIFSAYTLVNAVLSLVSDGSLPTNDLNTTLQELTPVNTIEIKSQ